ncbi:MAG: PAS domain-containing protein, partial [Campylobacterota bacterium]|nr:PAS domain-containing protein [Campylobacterota bacterium]
MKNLKIVFVFIFVVLFSLIALFLHYDKESQIKKNVDEQLAIQKLHLNEILEDYKQEAIDTSSIIATDKKVLEIFSQVKNASKERQQTLRKELYDYLNPLYQVMRGDGASQFHFVLPNSVSFLRFHNREFYDDNLSSFRDSYNLANSVDSDNIGYEIGRFGGSFRNVFTLYKDDEYLCAFEISYLPSSLQESLFYINKLHSDFLINKKVYEKIAAKIKENKNPYLSSKENSNFLISSSNMIKSKKILDSYSSILKDNAKLIKKSMNALESFAVYGKADGKDALVTFLPIKSFKGDKGDSYLVSYGSSSSYISQVLRNYYIKLIASFFASLLIVYLIYLSILHQDRIKKEKERFQLAIDGSNDGIWDWNILENSTYFSSHWKKMLGYSEDEIGGNFSELKGRIHPKDRERFSKDLLNHLSRNSDVFECEYRVKHKDGRWIWILGRGKAHFNSENMAARMVGFHTDITQKKEYENNQQQIIEQLKLASNAKQSFLACMSHEIRTPMNAILGYMQILKMREDDPKKLKMYGVIDTSGKSLLKIINDILDYSKIDSGNIDLESKEFNILSLFNEIVT